MGIFSHLLRSRPQNWSDNWLSDRVVEFYQGPPTAAGVRVGGTAAFRISTYYACVNVLSQDVAKLPLILYRRRADGGRERAVDHPLYRLLHNRPNQFQTAYRFRSTGQANLCHRGNAYAWITRYRGEVRELLPINPDRVTAQLSDDYRLTYRVDGKEESRPILHIRGLSLDGYTGCSVAHWARETLGLAAATEIHGSSLFSNGALFRGILKHPGKLKNDDVAKRMRESFDEAFRGEGNHHKTALLEDGVTYEKVSMTPEDSQFLQTREFQAYDIARWFRMPPHKVGLLKEAKYSTIEHAALEYVTDTLLSWLINWEQELSAALLSEEEQSEYFFEHLVDGLLRGDIKSRYQAYKDAILTGFMNRNEVRARENLNPADGLDEFLEPANMLPADEPRTEDT